MTQIVGYVDGITGQHAHGWIANTAYPQRLERVICRNAKGASLSFRAFIPRQDVCAALALTGRFGFAIPLAAIRSLGPMIQFTDAAGNVLQGGEAVAMPALLDPSPAPESTPKSNPGSNPASTIVFIHIQKSAGTSVRAAFSEIMPTGELLLVYPDGATGLMPSELAAIPRHQLEAVRLVMGHAFFGFADMLPNRLEYITVMRDPRTRLKSHYYHHVAAKTAFRIGELLVPTPLIVQHGLTDEFDNLATRMLAGIDTEAAPIRSLTEAHVDLAMEYIRTRFRFVAITEQLGAQFPALCKAVGAGSASLPFVNTRVAADVKALDRAVDWNEVIHHNRFDMMLYERVQAEGLTGRDLRAASPITPVPGRSREPVGTLVHRVASMAANPTPLDLVLLRRRQDTAPKIHVGNRVTGGVAPVPPNPPGRPPGDPVPQVLAVGM